MIHKMRYGWSSTALSAAWIWKVQAHNREITGPASSEGESLRTGFLTFIIIILIIYLLQPSLGAQSQCWLRWALTSRMEKWSAGSKSLLGPSHLLPPGAVCNPESVSSFFSIFISSMYKILHREGSESAVFGWFPWCCLPGPYPACRLSPPRLMRIAAAVCQAEGSED